ncbi:MAG TPA: protease modulator HflK [Candidatus Dormibacteraeota bacterium]|nr:protease modulator HflK [Candidatus Dormibacteraeota bacterium]
MSDETTKTRGTLPPGRETPVDAGSQALSEALRSSFGIVKVLMVLLVLAFFFSGVFNVGPAEQAIILRLGKPVGEGEKALLGPGLHFSFPFPIDDYEKIPISGYQHLSSTIGWYAVTPEQELAGIEPPPMPSLNPAVEGYVITADENIIHARATLTYHISDPIRFVFDFVNASNAVQSALDTALLQAASHFDVDDILTRDVVGFREAVRRNVTDLIEKRRLGIQVEQCTVNAVRPRQLKDAFANVLKAEVTRSKVLNEAHSYENQVLSKASADAASQINRAQSERAQLVAEISSRAQQFNDLLPKYNANPSLFVQQRLTETVGRVLTNVQDKILVPESGDGNSIELRYLFNRELPKPKTEQARP